MRVVGIENNTQQTWRAVRGGGGETGVKLIFINKKLLSTIYSLQKKFSVFRFNPATQAFPPSCKA